jgi:hypothetical protein
MMKKLLALVGLCFLGLSAQAQDDPEYRLELGVGAGVVGYLGDFNGNLTKDLQPVYSAVGRYVFNPYMALRLGVGIGKLKGASSDTETYYPDYADEPYEFNNDLVDVSVTYEYNFWPYGTGRDYRGAKRLTPFIFGGVGATYAKTPQKKVFTANFPLGLGLKYKIGERLNLGLEWAMHFSLDDKLDGVKDPYRVESSGAFKNTDCYSMLQLTLTYSLITKCATCNKE